MLEGGGRREGREVLVRVRMVKRKGYVQMAAKATMPWIAVPMYLASRRTLDVFLVHSVESVTYPLKDVRLVTTAHGTYKHMHDRQHHTKHY